MSKLIERLNRTTRSTPRRMGFGTAGAEGVREPGMVLIAELQDPASSQAAAQAGAEALYIEGTGTDHAQSVLAAIANAALPGGVPLSSVSSANRATLADSGCDFVCATLDDAAGALDAGS